MKYSSLILVFLVSLNSYGQDWFSSHQQGEPVKGYIITIAGDTLNGNITYDYPVIMQKRISFTSARNGETVIYQPKDIRGYACSGLVWVSASVTLDTYNGPIRFNRFGMLYSSQGPLELLRIFPEKDKEIKKMSSTKAETIYKGIYLTQDKKSFRDLYIKKLEDPAESVNTSDFRKDFINMMARRISDDKELMEKVNNRELRYDDLPEIVKEYNQWFSKNQYSR